MLVLLPRQPFRASASVISYPPLLLSLFFLSSSELPRLGPLSHGVEISKTVILLACHFYRDSGLAGDLEIGVIIRGSDRNRGKNTRGVGGGGMENSADSATP